MTRLRPRSRRAARVAAFLNDAADSPGNALAARRGREPFDYPGSRRLMSLVPDPVDIVHAHNLHGGYFDLRELRRISRRVPLALTLHDEWTYTGHCAHAFDLPNWRTGCHACPDRHVYPVVTGGGDEATHENWAAKRSIYEKSRLYVTTPSRWLMDRARDSILAEAAAAWRVIPNGVDTAIFRPGDRLAARTALGLPPDRHILLFTANRLRRSVFKDVETVLAAARSVAERVAPQPVLLLALGDKGPPEVRDNAELRFVPYEADQERLAAFYRAADVYLHAAHAENFPTTILEALASGTPVVATAVGGIPEQIRSLAGAPGAWSSTHVEAAEATGVLVDRGDAEGMAAAASAIVSDANLRGRLGENAVRDAASRFPIEAQLDATLSWYRELIADWREWSRAPAGGQRPGGSHSPSA